MNHVCNTCTILKQQLAAAKAELAELNRKYRKEVRTVDDLTERAEQAEAQCAAYKKALDIAMSTNQSHETYCKVEAALEEKP